MSEVRFSLLLFNFNQQGRQCHQMYIACHQWCSACERVLLFAVNLMLESTTDYETEDSIFNDYIRSNGIKAVK